MPGTKEDVIDMGTMKITTYLTSGYCYAHSSNESQFCKEVKEDSYCPDYSNRKEWNRRFKETLQDWVKRLNE